MLIDISQTNWEETECSNKQKKSWKTGATATDATEIRRVFGNIMKYVLVNGKMKKKSSEVEGGGFPPRRSSVSLTKWTLRWTVIRITQVKANAVIIKASRQKRKWHTKGRQCAWVHAGFLTETVQIEEKQNC